MLEQIGDVARPEAVSLEMILEIEKRDVLTGLPPRSPAVDPGCTWLQRNLGRLINGGSPLFLWKLVSLYFLAGEAL